ncbi:response regulator [uncultured Slackia sp.]|nr:response regulator [uncultured Slackia sp.]
MGAVAGSQALEKFANVKPDLVILDIMMPGLDGFEVCGLGYRLGD